MTYNGARTTEKISKDGPHVVCDEDDTYFFSDIHLSLDSCNKKRTKFVSCRDNEHFSKSRFLHANIFAILANFINLTFLVKSFQYS